MPVPSNLYKTSTQSSKTAKLNGQPAVKASKAIKSTTTSSSGSTTTTTTTTTTTIKTTTGSTTVAAATTSTLAAVTQLAKTATVPVVVKQNVLSSTTLKPVAEKIIDQVVDSSSSVLSDQTNDILDTSLSSENNSSSENSSFIEELLEQQPDLFFYVWTTLLASLLAFFVFKKFKQWKRMQARQHQQAQQKNIKQSVNLQQQQQISPKSKVMATTSGGQTIQQINLQQNQQPTYVIVLLKLFDVLKIVLMFLFTMAKLLLSWLISSTTSGDFFIPTSDSGLDNFFKWFYFNVDSTRSINSSVLSALNETAQKHQHQKIGGGVENNEEVYFRSVDISAPRFSNTKTVVNDNDSLTMKSQVQMGNVDLKLELRRQKRQLDLKVTNLTAQIKIVLSNASKTQSSSSNSFTLYNLDLFVDPEWEPTIYINHHQPNQPLDAHLSRLINELIKETCKQLVLTIEFNFNNNKIQSNSRLVLKNPQQQQQSPRNVSSSLNQPLIINTSNNLSKQASQNSTSANNNNKSPSQLSPTGGYEQQNRLQPSPSVHSHSRYSPKPETRSHTETTSNAASNNNSAVNSPNHTINHSNSGAKTNLTINSVDTQQNQHQQNNSMPSSPTTPSVLSPELIHQLRSTLNEKQLLVKLVKTTNLASCEEPYCVVELDYPMQKHITDVCKDMTTNIDEQFLFDITANSEELSFSIFDKARDYGNDLIGEAVLPVNDLCSNLTSKRVIQLHRYGQTKSGSITVEFAFLEPLNSSGGFDSRQQQQQQTNRESRNSMGRMMNNNVDSSSPNAVNSLISHYTDKQLNISTSSPVSGGADSMSYATPQMRGNTSNSQSYSPNHLERGGEQSPQSPGAGNAGGYSAFASSINNSTQISPNGRANMQQQQQQQGAPTRVINRNYLQVQSLKRNQNQQNNSLLMSGGGSASSDITDLSDPKRTKSLSRSLKNLFVKQPPLTPVVGTGKREKSLDSSNLLGAHSMSSGSKAYDAHSIAAGPEHLNFNKSKTIGGSLRKLFKIKNKKYSGHVHETTALGGGGGVTLSSPSSPLMPGASPASHHHSFQATTANTATRPVSPTIQMSPANRHHQLVPPSPYQPQAPPSPSGTGSQLSYYQQQQPSQQQRDASASVSTGGQNYAYGGALASNNERQSVLMSRGYASP